MKIEVEEKLDQPFVLTSDEVEKITAHLHLMGTTVLLLS
jgi:hypothetical protein